MRSIYEPEYRALISYLVQLRKSQNISQLELGRLLGTDQTLISKVENHVRRLDVLETKRWCEALNVDIVEVLKINWD